MKQDWSDEELLEVWELTADEKRFILSKKVESTLGFAIKLKYYRSYVGLIDDWKDIADCIVEYMRKQLPVFNQNKDISYDLNTRTSRQHNQEIREYLGYRKVNERYLEQIRELLFNENLAQNPSDNALKEVVYNILYKEKVERFSDKELSKYLREWKSQYEEEFYKSI